MNNRLFVQSFVFK